MPEKPGGLLRREATQHCFCKVEALFLTGYEGSKDTAWVSWLMLGESADREATLSINVILSDVHDLNMRYRQHPAWN